MIAVKLDFLTYLLIRGGNRALNASTIVSAESPCPSAKLLLRTNTNFLVSHFMYKTNPEHDS